MPKKREIWCTNMTGASQILNRHRNTIQGYINDGLIDDSRCFRYGRNTLIPMGEIAKLMKAPENQAVNAAKSLDLPLWRCKK
ncbi:MAG: hypothetical protein QG646_1867 [Euryarchaeota archaeon]|nr:hypothetical protein [Euryarchaeota archaeon]